MPTYRTYELQTRHVSSKQKSPKKRHPDVKKIHALRIELREAMNHGMEKLGFEQGIDYYSLNTDDQTILAARAKVAKPLHAKFEALEQLQQATQHELNNLKKTAEEQYSQLSKVSKDVAKYTQTFNHNKTVLALREKEYKKATSVRKSAKDTLKKNRALLKSIERHQRRLDASEKAIDKQLQSYENTMARCQNRISKLERDITELRSGKKTLSIIDKVLGISVDEKITFKQQQMEYNQALRATTLAVHNKQKPQLEQQRLELRSQQEKVAVLLPQAKKAVEESKAHYKAMRAGVKQANKALDKAQSNCDKSEKRLNAAQDDLKSAKKSAATQCKALNQYAIQHEMPEHFSVESRTHHLSRSSSPIARNANVASLVAQNSRARGEFLDAHRENNRVKSRSQPMLASHPDARAKMDVSYREEKATLHKPASQRLQRVASKFFGEATAGKENTDKGLITRFIASIPC